jgi:hypothetical protein
MKKLSIISNQIKNNTYSYTGKGSFESIVNKNKDLILDWLDDLVALQKQIDMLADLEGINFQKRNYTRILTKLFPKEYKEFVSLNILVRDANIIAQYYDNEFNMTILYDNLINHKYLKYPGKYDKYVEYNIFQKFVMIYKDELVQSLHSNHQTPKNNNTKHIIKEKTKIEKPIKTEQKTDLKQKQESKISKDTKESKDTNWTQLLLGKLK